MVFGNRRDGSNEGMGPDNENSLTIHLPETISPDAISDSAEGLTLGIGLSQLELVPDNNTDDGN